MVLETRYLKGMSPMIFLFKREGLHNYLFFVDQFKLKKDAAKGDFFLETANYQEWSGSTNVENIPLDDRRVIDF